VFFYRCRFLEKPHHFLMKCLYDSRKVRCNLNVCVKGSDVVSDSMILPFDFVIDPTVWYSLFFILISLYLSCLVYVIPCICHVLYMSCLVYVMSCICHVLYMSCLVHVMSCICHVLYMRNSIFKRKKGKLKISH